MPTSAHGLRGAAPGREPEEAGSADVHARAAARTAGPRVSRTGSAHGARLDSVMRPGMSTAARLTQTPGGRAARPVAGALGSNVMCTEHSCADLCLQSAFQAPKPAPEASGSRDEPRVGIHDGVQKGQPRSPACRPCVNHKQEATRRGGDAPSPTDAGQVREDGARPQPQGLGESPHVLE